MVHSPTVCGVPANSCGSTGKMGEWNEYSILMHLCLTVETYLIFIDSSPVHEIGHASALSQKQQPDYVILGTINMFVWLTAIQSLMST